MDDNSRIPVNVLYFGIFLAFLILFSGETVFVHDSLSGSRFFFFLYAIGQSVLEITLFILIGWAIRTLFGSIWFSLFIGATFFFFFAHVCDFLVNRVLDLSVYETLMTFVFGSTLEQFLYLLDASGIPNWAWMLFFAGLGVIPLIGIACYRITEIALKPFCIKREWALQTFICLPAALILWDFSASKMIHPDTYTSFIKSLPWKFTFLQPETVRIPLESPLSKPPSEEELSALIAQNQTHLETKPNIYLFIIESLREDFITPEIAPNLSRFREENHSFKLALSNANATNMAWFSLLHSQYPHFWNEQKKSGWGMGSPALALLKKWGYQIRVLTSAQLGYFGMEELLFGKQVRLLDSYETFHHSSSVSAATADQDTIQSLCKQIEQKSALQQGQMFVVFLDSTHFDYSFPLEPTLKFMPIDSSFAYFKAFVKSDIEPVKNRYRNAICYIDSLLGHFFASCPNKEEAVILIAGDHGEEFFEHGHLFHGSHLIHEQTHIPFYLKFGSNERALQNKELVSQMDLFPSLLDYLGQEPIDWLPGESIFRERQRPYALIARFNANFSPYELCLHNGTEKLIFQFSQRGEILKSKELKIRSICNARDQTLMEKGPVQEWVGQNFGPAISSLLTGTITTDVTF